MRIAVVVPRYGREVLGVAESWGRGFAEEAARQKWSVEVWTTCAQTHYTWENYYPAGSENADGVIVRRFPITGWDPGRRAALDIKLNTLGTMSAQEQYAWLESGPHSIPLYEHVAQHAAEFDAVVALPYATPLVHYAAWAAPEHVVLCPCLHDEPYAYMEPTHLLLQGVWGVMFNSLEEVDLATAGLGMRLRRYGVLGGGATLSKPSRPANPASLPYLLYAGRLEGGKNVALLYEYVQRYWDEGGRVRLVILGSGPLTPPAHAAFDYRGFASEDEKATDCASALAMCQPSLNESFSFTIMEAWLAGRPVLVHADCPVTRGHVRRSSGGLWFRTYEEFAAAVDWLLANERLADRLGANGHQYVLHNYTWPAIITRFEVMIRHWQQLA